MSKINIKGTEITILSLNEDDYISLTDMVKAKDGDFFVSDWLRNRNTIEFLGVWEGMNNPRFNYGEFAIIKSKAGLNSYKISVKEWVEKTNAIGLQAKTGRYGGTYANKDIAFEFGMWISAEFKLLLITEFQRLKKQESDRLETGWDYRRFLSKTNYTIHTDAIKEYIVPEITEEQAKYIYTNEADILNVALFGVTAKEWREANPQLSRQGKNIRDLADLHQLMVLSNLESTNAYLMSKHLSQYERLIELRKSAIQQLKSLRNSSYTIEKIQSPYKYVSASGSPSPKKISSGAPEPDESINKALKKKLRKE